MPKRGPLPIPFTNSPLPGADKRFPAKLSEGEIKESYKVRWNRDMSESQRKAALTRHKNALSKERAESNEKVWQIDGMLMSRYEVMDYIVILVSEGMDRVTLCKQDNWPTLAQTEGWYKRHPDFRVAMDNALRLRGEILGEAQIHEVADANPQTAGLAKIRGEVYGKAAARMNSKYQDKQVVQTEDVTEKMTIGDIERKILAMQERFPKLRELGMKKIDDAIVVNGDDANE